MAILHLIILGVLCVIALVVAARISRRCRTGEGNCHGCGRDGGGAADSPAKPAGPATATRRYRVGGMHCEHCRGHVESALNAIEGVTATVSLEKGEALVERDRDVPDGVLVKAVEEAGFTLAPL